METAALLVKKDELQAYLEGILKEEEEVVRDLNKIVPYVENKSLRGSLERRRKQGEDCLVALRAGFVPISSGYFTKVDTKSKWQKKWVKETLDSMPPEVKEVWEKVKAQGIFDTFAVTTAGGDPLLVGKKGKKNFFIAGWLPIAPGIGMGLRIKLP